jgi:lipopolysaccharide transport system permease protein
MAHHLTAVWKFRHFLLSLVRLDLRTRYTRSAIGLGWTVIQPVVMAGVFVVVFSGVLGLSPERYVTTLLLGLAVWGFFREAALSGCLAFTGHEAYIRQSPLPYALYPLRIVLGTAVHSAIALAVALAAVAVVDGGFDKVRVVWAVVPVLALLVAAGWAVATLFAFAQVYFHDTRHLLDIGAQILFFLTPIMYSRSVLDQKGLGWVVDLNPVNLYLELIRTPLLTGHPPAAAAYATGAAATAVLVGLAAGTAAWLQKKVIFHL